MHWQHKTNSHTPQTRITTKYTTLDPLKPSKSKRTASAQPPVPTTAASQPARAYLTLKAHDTASGVTLKYKTTKQQEVGRLFASLGRLGRFMAGLPELKEDAVMADAPIADEGVGAADSGVATPVPEKASTTAPTAGKKKKKGKK